MKAFIKVQHCTEEQFDRLIHILISFPETTIHNFQIMPYGIGTLAHHDSLVYINCDIRDIGDLKEYVRTIPDSKIKEIAPLRLDPDHTKYQKAFAQLREQYGINIEVITQNEKTVEIYL